MPEKWMYFLLYNFYNLDNDVQKTVYLNYRNLVYRDIYFLFRNHELAEDIVQESFLKVVAKAPKLKNTKNMKAWIIKISRNKAYDFFKKNKKYHHFSEPDIILNERHDLPVSDQVEDIIRNELLNEALNKLSIKYRQALFLYYVEEKSYKEIAIELGTTEQALAQTMVRARKKLYQHFSRKWVDRDG
ncbi:RNA polymerase sigma factor [Paenibacillus senegalensis]|uniref:RNA polymerase sigma factor n=1 Tax=Paenibacillus senegalensis TaxID=1465766 RepID=UPI000288190D|nr:RNA polymerase sigma factor [Paenibacillus senegalensis]